MKKTTDRRLTLLADAAFEQTVRKVIERAERTGTPVIVWEAGAVKVVEPRITQQKSKVKRADRE